MRRQAPMIRVGAVSTFETVQELEEYLGGMPTAAYVCDSAGLITYFNSEAARMWGRSPALLDDAERYSGAAKLFNEDGSPMPLDMSWMALALKNRREYNARTVIIERPDATRVIALAHASPMWDEDGSLAGALNVLVPITDRKLLRAVSPHVGQRLSLVVNTARS